MTIKKLGLNIRKLQALRSDAIEPFLDPTWTDEDFNAFVTGYLEIGADGRLGRFWTTIRYMFSPATA